jgi:hypothetical protein
MTLQCRQAVLLGVFLIGVSLGRAAALEPPCSSAVRFELEPKASIASGLQGNLVLRPLEGEDREPMTLAARVGAPVSAQLPCASKWEVTAAFPGTWGPRATVVAGTGGESLTSRLALWPLGQIAGSVKLAEKGERLPKTLTVTTLAPRAPNRRDAPKGSQDCPIDAKGRWQCPSLPGTTFDLVLAAQGFIPQYRWGLKVVPGKTTDLGTVELKRGASVAGWVEVEEGAIDPACRARLTLLTGPGSGAQIAEKVWSTAREVPVRKDGFFQLMGVAPGNYSLEIRQPGFASATVRPIEVWPRLESFLRQPVTLRRPIQVELAISPQLDWLGRPWQVLVFRQTDAGAGRDDTAYNGPADDQGVVKIPGQAPGLFSVHVSDGLDNQLYTKNLRITGPGDARQTIDLKILTVRGTVTLGKEPLAATMWFGGRYGATGVKMESDRDGKFQGILPRDGWWGVQIASLQPKFETRVRVNVEANTQERATVEINLPATRVFGKVLDDDGRPLPSAIFSLSTDEDNVVTDTDGAGNFEVRGLPEGLAYAAATFSSAQGHWSSDRISFFLREGEDVGPLELRAHKEKRLSGTVQSARGPVPGAGITVVPLRPTLMFGDSVRTELDGTFTAQVPASTEMADVIVSPPGYALRAFAVPLGETAQSLTVDGESGTLVLLGPEDSKEAGKESISLWVFQNGLPLPWNELAHWSRDHGKLSVGSQKKEVEVPEMAPGEYRACLATQSVLVSWQASGFSAPLAKCTTGQLTAGGTLRLDLSQK